MMQPVLLIFATRYDDVTRRTYGIAERLVSSTEQLGILSMALFEVAATGENFQIATTSRPSVIAFYCHGDTEGVILAQDQQPCWTRQTVPDLSGTAVFAHACRGIRWLMEQATDHKARLLVGYEGDLITPSNGSALFREMYEELHSFIPHHLAAKADEKWIHLEFYNLSTRRFHELDRDHAPLMELVAIQQSRDEIVFV